MCYSFPAGCHPSRRRNDRLDLGEQPPGLVVEQRLGETFPEVVDGLRRGVDQIVGIETVVAQVVRQDLEGGEVECLRKAFGELLDRHPQRGLARGIPRKPVAQVPHGTHRQQDPLAGQRSVEEFGKGADNLLDA